MVEFIVAENNQTIVTLSHLGWKEGDQWDEVYDYFDNAWSYVLSNLKTFIEGDCK